MAWLVKVWILGWGVAWAGALQPLSINQLTTFKKEPCVLIYPWAAWCPQCVQSLPQLLPSFAKWPKGKVIVLDLSSTGTQETFSKKWKIVSQGDFPTYFQIDDKQETAYQKAISPNWNGDLPYAVLYRHGKKKQEWKGKIVAEKIAQQVEGLCR
jgi:thiol-disulfide isomerase/thioredoxin